MTFFVLFFVVSLFLHSVAHASGLFVPLDFSSLAWWGYTLINTALAALITKAFVN